MTKYVNLAEQFHVSNLGVFKINPKESNHCKPWELSREGFPLERLVELEIMAELISSQPYNPQTDLDCEGIEQFVREMCIRNS